MQVTLLNPDQIKNIFKSWGEFAATCYDTPQEFAEKVGNSCYQDEHYSGSRTEFIKFKIEGVDRGVSEQAMRHEIGVRYNFIDDNTYDENPMNIVKNLKSFRYVDMENFDYTIPKTIESIPKALNKYNKLMEYINTERIQIKDILVQNDINEKQAIEDANYSLPRATNTSLVIAFTLEAFIHYLHKRLCTRTQYFHRQIAKLMKNEVLNVLPQIKDRLVSQCEYLLWCPEGTRSCKKYPTRDMLLKGILN